MRKFIIGISTYAFCTLAIVSTNVSASETTSNKVIVSKRGAVIVANAGGSQSSCYYEDKRYSIGAVLQVDEVYIECVEKNGFELNGSLTWRVIQFGQAPMEEITNPEKSGKKVYRTP